MKKKEKRKCVKCGKAAEMVRTHPSFESFDIYACSVCALEQVMLEAGWSEL